MTTNKKCEKREWHDDGCPACTKGSDFCNCSLSAPVPNKKCGTDGKTMWCYCGNCKQEDYPLPKVFSAPVPEIDMHTALEEIRKNQHYFSGSPVPEEAPKECEYERHLSLRAHPSGGKCYCKIECNCPRCSTPPSTDDRAELIKKCLFADDVDWDMNADGSAFYPKRWQLVAKISSLMDKVASEARKDIRSLDEEYKAGKEAGCTAERERIREHLENCARDYELYDPIRVGIEVAIAELTPKE